MGSCQRERHCRKCPTARCVWLKEPADWSVARHANGAICRGNHNGVVLFKTVHFSNVFWLVSTVRKWRWRRTICECVIIASNFVDWYKRTTSLRVNSSSRPGKREDCWIDFRWRSWSIYCYIISSSYTAPNHLPAHISTSKPTHSPDVRFWEVVWERLLHIGSKVDHIGAVSFRHAAMVSHVPLPLFMLLCARIIFIIGCA